MMGKPLSGTTTTALSMTLACPPTKIPMKIGPPMGAVPGAPLPVCRGSYPGGAATAGIPPCGRGRTAVATPAAGDRSDSAASAGDDPDGGPDADAPAGNDPAKSEAPEDHRDLRHFTMWSDGFLRSYINNKKD